MGKVLGGAVLAVAALAMSVTPTGWAAPAGPPGPGPSAAPPASGGAAVVARPVVPAVPVVPGRPARPGQETEADDGLRSEAKTSFVVDPGARVIRASTEMTLTHQYDPDYYFHGYDVPVLAESVNHRVVRSDGASLSVDVEPAPDPESGVAYALVSLRPNLFAGDSITFRLDYDLPFQAPRSPGWSRGNDAVVTFPAFTPGDPGLSRVEVRVPLDYEVEVGGAEPQRSEADGHHVLTEEAIPEPWMYTAVIVATRDDAMLEQEREVGDRTLRLRAWPDDAAWIDYVGGQLEAQMPVLEDLTGQSWPAERGELEVVESSAPGAHGYAGWFDHAENSIALGDAFDPATIAHELAHVWFNGELFTGRWINEAFADEYAESTLAELATPGFLPSAEPPPDPAGPGAVALNDWEDTWAFEDVDHVRERYAYLTSWYVLDQIADEIGPEGLRGVVAAAADREVTYGGDPEGESLTGNITWRVLLDMIENEGSTRADGLFRTFVANPEQRAEMDARAVARPAYAALVERGDGWTPPFELRRAMGVWDFDEVEGLIATADEVLAVRAEAEEVLAGLDVELEGLEVDYETARDVDALVDTAGSTLDAARAYRNAAGHHDDVAGGPIAKLGLLFSGTDESLRDAATDLREGRPGGALAAAERVDERLDTAVRNGILRLAAAVLLVALLVALLVWGPVHRRRRRRAADAAREREVRQIEEMFAAPATTPGISARPPVVHPTAPPTSAHPPPVTVADPPSAPPTGPPVAPPVGSSTGPPLAPPTGPPVAPSTGPPLAPPTGPPVAPPTGPPVAPPIGPPVAPPTAPPTVPPGGSPAVPGPGDS